MAAGDQGTCPAAVSAVLFGTMTPLPLRELLTRDPGGGSADYRQRFIAATRHAVADGFLLASGEAAIIEMGAAQWPFWPSA